MLNVRATSHFAWVGLKTRRLSERSNSTNESQRGLVEFERAPEHPSIIVNRELGDKIGVPPSFLLHKAGVRSRIFFPGIAPYKG